MLLIANKRRYFCHVFWQIVVRHMVVQWFSKLVWRWLEIKNVWGCSALYVKKNSRKVAKYFVKDKSSSIMFQNFSAKCFSARENAKHKQPSIRLFFGACVLRNVATLATSVFAFAFCMFLFLYKMQTHNAKCLFFAPLFQCKALTLFVYML